MTKEISESYFIVTREDTLGDVPVGAFESLPAAKDYVDSEIAVVEPWWGDDNHPIAYMRGARFRIREVPKAGHKHVRS